MASLVWSQSENQQLSQRRRPQSPAAAPSTPVLRDQSPQGSGVSPACHVKFLDYSVVIAQADLSLRFSRWCKKSPGARDTSCTRLWVKEQGLFKSKVARTTRSPAWQEKQGTKELWKQGVQVAAKMNTSGQRTD